MWNRLRTAAAIVLAACALGPPCAAARTVAGVSFEETVEAGGALLRLDGTAVHHETFLSIPVFAVGLYREAAATPATGAGECAVPTRVQTHWLRDVSRDQLLARWREKLPGGDGAATDGRVEALVEALPDLREGDRLTFDWSPARGVSVAHNGRERVNVPGRDLCRAMLASLLDEDTDTRRALLLSQR